MTSPDERKKGRFKRLFDFNKSRKEKSTGDATPISRGSTPNQSTLLEQTKSETAREPSFRNTPLHNINARADSSTIPSHGKNATISSENGSDQDVSTSQGLTPFPTQSSSLTDKGKQPDHKKVPSLSIQKPSDGDRQFGVAVRRQISRPGNLSPAVGINRRRGSSGASARSSLGKREASQIVEDRRLKHIFPNANDISCTLVVTYNNEVIRKNDPVVFEPFPWHEPGIYEKVVAAIEAQKKTKQAEAEKGHFLRLYSGSFRVVGQDYEYSEKISSLLQLEEITIQNICGVIHKHPKQRFQLEYFVDYSSVRTQKKRDNERYCDMVRDEVQRLMYTNTNFHKQSFVPRNHRDQFASKEIISGIISEQTSLDLGANEALTNKIIRNGATGLFLACITNYHNLATFRHLFETCHFRDDALPPINQMPASLKDLSELSYHRLVEHVHAYFAKTIEGRSKHEELENHEVMPILHVRDDPTKESTLLGDGGAGSVYKVSIESGHHTLPGHNKSQFALKMIPEAKKHLFERERAMLSRLRDNRHPHIVRHIMTWGQGGTSYILYPLARGNLRTYMGEFRPPQVSWPSVRWFLRQTCGLASAIHHIHEQQERDENAEGHSSPTPPGSIDPRTWKRLSVDSTRKPPSKWSGYHHDLKPENILIFERREGINPVFKISDFGAGKFSDLKEGEVSHKASNLGGTTSYFGPEYDKDRSRPFDIWAMACVLTELLIWFLQDVKLKEFHDARVLQSVNTPGFSMDCYWHEAEGQRWLKQSVLEYLNEIEKNCAQAGESQPSSEAVLQDLPKLIKRCFEIDPLKRPSARQLHEALQQMHERAEIAPEEAEMSIHTPSTPGSRHSQDDGTARFHSEATLPPAA